MAKDTQFMLHYQLQSDRSGCTKDNLSSVLMSMHSMLRTQSFLHASASSWTKL